MQDTTLSIEPGNRFDFLWKTPQRTRPALNLALQGGGAHGAFTWGVLDALLQDPRISFEGLSGSSAGAMNAVVLASGWLDGGPKHGREGARAALGRFWSSVGQQLPFKWLTQGQGDNISLTPVGKMMMHWAGQFAPAQINPFDLNPLRELLLQQVDFERLRAASAFKLFVAATQANTGQLRVFREHELSVDTLLASACLPKIHHPVHIDGEAYWDGAYSANPAVFPLFYECDSSDVLLVLLSPLKHASTPQSIEEIEQRALELAFSAHFTREMRTFAQASEFSRGAFMPLGRLERRLLKMRFHMVDSQDLASLQRTETKIIADGPFLQLLHDQGLARGQAWLGAHGDALGRHSTVDLKTWSS